MNDGLQDAPAHMTWELLTTDGTVLLSAQKDVLLPANASIQLAEADLSGVAFDPVQTVMRVRLFQDGRIVNECRYFFAPFAEMAAKDAHVDCHCRRTGESTFEVTLTADRFVWLLHLAEPDGVTCSANDFDLWPGEEKALIVTTDNAQYQPVLHWIGMED